MELNFLEEKINESYIQLASYQGKMTNNYNAKVKKKVFHIALTKIFLYSKDLGIRMLYPNWGGPYQIKEKTRPDTYIIENMERK